MSAKNAFLNEFYSIKNDPKQYEKFTSTSLETNNRAYPVLNTNIKTLSTYASYLYAIHENPTADHHEKYEVLRKFRAFYKDSPQPLSEEEIKHRENRIKILLKAVDTFDAGSTKSHSFSRFIVAFVLSLNSNYGTYERTDYLFDTIPSNLLAKCDNYVYSMLKNDEKDIRNPLFAIAVFISSPKLLDLYLDYYESDEIDFEKTINDLKDDDMIIKRVKSCQSSALKIEGLLFVLYEHVIGFSIYGMTYELIIDSFFDYLKIKLDKIKYREFKKNLLNPEPDFFNGLKSFFKGLNEEERKEVILALETLGSGMFDAVGENVSSIEDYDDTQDGEGYDVQVSSKSRRGQSKFTRNLSRRVGVGREHCEIIGCPVCGLSYLKSSHILRWNLSNKNEKVNAYNGLLLCPNHDYLFDKLLISFDMYGNIMLRNDIDASIYAAFHVKPTDKINYDPRFEVFMAKHREAFKNGGWNKK